MHRNQRQQSTNTIAFMIGTCPFCDHTPKPMVIGETDVLYRCPICDFPVETFCIMNFLAQYEPQLDQQCQQIDLMLQKREQLIR